MSANFYTDHALMMGIDYHIYIVAAEGVPAPFPLWPHVVGIRLDIGSETKLTPKITATGHAMVQEGSSARSAHTPIPVLPPHPFEVAQLAFLQSFAWSKARLANATVKGKGAPLACCISDFAGWNANCSDIPVPTNVVLSITTVMTHISVSDVFRAAWAHALDYLFRYFWKYLGVDNLLKDWLKSLGPGLSDIARSIAKKFLEKVDDNKKHIIEEVNKLKDEIQKAIEHATHSAASGNIT